jgi:flavin-dependent dehydrogenase
LKGSISEWDIVIVGAGPAGLYAAALLARRFSVLVVDRRPIGSGKSCAGLMSEEAHRLLRRIGEDGDFYEEPARIDLHAIVEEREFPAQAFWNVDRGALQAWMAKKAESAGAVIARSTLRSIGAAKHAWNLAFDEEKLVLAKVVIGADGAASLIRRSLGFADPQFVMARQCILEGSIDSAYLVLRRDAGCLYYCWAVPKRGGILIGAADPVDFPGRAVRVLSASVTEFTPASAIAEERGFYTKVNKMDDIALGCPGAFLIGEAAGLVLPSSGEGFGGAFESAAALAEVISESGLSAAGLGCTGTQAVFEDYRRLLAPRLLKIEKDLELYNSLSAGSL